MIARPSNAAAVSGRFRSKNGLMVSSRSSSHGSGGGDGTYRGQASTPNMTSVFDTTAVSWFRCSVLEADQRRETTFGGRELDLAHLELRARLRRR